MRRCLRASAGGPALLVIAWHGLAWAGRAWPGLAWPGLAWPGQSWPGLAGRASSAAQRQDRTFGTMAQARRRLRIDLERADQLFQRERLLLQ